MARRPPDANLVATVPKFLIRVHKYLEALVAYVVQVCTAVGEGQNKWMRMEDGSAAEAGLLNEEALRAASNVVNGMCSFFYRITAL